MQYEHNIKWKTIIFQLDLCLRKGIKMKLNIVMVEPEIPQNTGNIARTCAITGAKLHLVHPLGFKIDEKSVKRAGLDYWDKLDIEEHKSLEDFLNKYNLKVAMLGAYFNPVHSTKELVQKEYLDLNKLKKVIKIYLQAFINLNNM